MVLKIKNSFFLVFLIFLQSCSGDRIGNFFESSFKNVEDNKKIKEDFKNTLENKKVLKSEINSEAKLKNKKIKEDFKNTLENKKVLKSEINSEAKLENNKKKIKDNKSQKKRNYKPQSYKIIFILKDVDPKAPIENLSTILRNSDVNFEIEKIERFFDSKNKSIKRN